MTIDLSKPDVVVSDDEVKGTLVTGDTLRSRIRELISSFYARPRPVMPSEATILNDYLLNSSEKFIVIRNNIADIQSEMAGLKKDSPGYVRLKRREREQWALRNDVMSDVVLSEEFLKFRADTLSRYNTALQEFERDEGVIHDLKPYLGMPTLPNIEAETLTASYILRHLQHERDDRPLKGQMVLQESEDVHSRPQFMSRSSAFKGIKSLLFSSDVIPVPFSLTHSSCAKAMAAGAFQRGRRVYFPVSEGRPVCNTSWSEIDSFLPFAFRSLTVPQLPLIEPTCSRFHFKTVFQGEAWEQICEEVLETHAHTCLVCGDDEKTTVHPLWQFNEPVIGSFSPGVQKLLGFTVFCPNCSDVFRPSLESILNKAGDNYVLSIDGQRRSWLKTVNKWDDAASLDYPRDAFLIALEAYRRRSRHNWLVDLSKQRSLYFVLEKGYELNYDGWITSPDRTPFKIVGAPFRYDGTVRTSYKAPSIYCVPWGSDVSKVSKLLEEKFNLSTVDRKGAGAPDAPSGEQLPLSSTQDGEEEGEQDIEHQLSEETSREIEEIRSNDPEVLPVDASSRPSDQAVDDDDEDYSDDDVAPAPDYDSIYGDDADDTGFDS